MACGESNLTIFPCVLWNVLIIISNTTSLSFALKRIGPLGTILLCCFYLLVLKFLITIKPPKNLSCNIYSETLLKPACQHLMLLVGLDTLTYRKDYDRSPTLVGHQESFLAPLPGSVALLVSGIGKENFYRKCCFYFCLLLYFIMERQSLSDQASITS